MEAKNILITRRTVPLMTLDGINIFIAIISEYLIQLGFEVTVIGIGDVDTKRYKDAFGVKESPNFIKSSNNYKRSFLNEFLFHVGLLKVIKNRKWDYVIQNGVSFFSGRNFNLLLCHDWERTFWNRKIQQFIQKKIYSRTKFQIAATSTEIQRELSNFVGRQTHLLPTCVKFETKETLPYSKRFRITHIGTQDYKNPLGSLKVFEDIDDGNMILTYIGKTTYQLDNAIDLLNDDQKSRIQFFSNLPHTKYISLINESIFCSIPSTYIVGVLSPTCLDAFNSATPVIGSGLSSDLFKCNFNGLAVKNACYKKIISETEWNFLSENARSTANKFRVENVGKMLETILVAK